MRTLRFLLRKEFKQIFRNTTLLRMIIMIPVVQLIIMPLAADYEIKNINISIIDKDHSSYSRELTNEITASGYFILVNNANSFKEGFKTIEDDKSDLVLEIPTNFERNLNRENHENLFVAVNAINGTKANVGGAYLMRIVNTFNQNIRMKWMNGQTTTSVPTLDISTMNWFNPNLNYRYFMVPAILVILVTMIGSYMCALNIVKEKEVGTIEQINVTPIKKYQFILGKLIPFLIIGIFVFSLGLFVIARLVYGIESKGSLVLLYAYLFLFLVAVLGIGLLISTYSNTQQQAMSLAFFATMLFILMGGLFTSVDSMPEWAKTIAYLNPVTYFIDATRMIVMKGSGFRHVQSHFIVMFGFAVFFNGWAILNYKKTS